MRRHGNRYARTLVAVGAMAAALLFTQLVAVAGDDVAGGVDFRMRPLEQARKIHAFAAERTGAIVTFSVMESSVAEGDGQHILLSSSVFAAREPLRRQLAPGSISGVSWGSRDGARLLGTCDTNRECEDKTKELCQDAGHGGIHPHSVMISTNVDGSKTCSADCKEHGAIAFVTCRPRVRGF